jgi:hypothetical protein
VIQLSRTANYKLLKKKIKDIMEEQSADGESGQSSSGGAAPGVASSSSPSSSSSSSAADSAATDEAGRGASSSRMQSSAAEKAFFKSVHQEVRKSSEFFTMAVERQCTGRRDRVREGLRQLQAPYEEAALPDDAATFLLAACLEVYKELIMLENFAIMCHTAFSKILKKHDKRTGYTTREAFMARVVANASFARYPNLKQMLAELEQMYLQILALQPASGGDTGGAAAGPDGGSSNNNNSNSSSSAPPGAGSVGAADDDDRGDVVVPLTDRAVADIIASVGSTAARNVRLSPALKAGYSRREIEIAKIMSADSRRELQHELSGGGGSGRDDNDDSEDDESPKLPPSDSLSQDDAAVAVAASEQPASKRIKT